MYAVGRLGSYISRGVYTVSGPFHPFGGAVDIIVVEQQDGSFKSSPWYVRFGKFQGVLKSREKVVNISIDGVEADFHMYLDHKGEAYFLREVDSDEEEESGLFPLSSGEETDGQSQNDRRPLKANSFNIDVVDSSPETKIDNKALTRSKSSQSRFLGIFGRKATKEENLHEGDGDSSVTRANSLERAEIAADLLELQWSTNLSTKKKTKGKISNSNSSSLGKLDGEVDKDLQASDEKSSDQVVETPTVGESVLAYECEVISEISRAVSEACVGDADRDDIANSTASEISCILKGCTIPQMDGRKNGVQPSLECEIAGSPVIELNDSAKQTGETLHLINGGGEELYIHTETLPRTTSRDSGRQVEDEKIVVDESIDYNLQYKLASGDESEKIDRDIASSESSEEEQFVIGDVEDYKMGGAETVALISPDHLDNENRHSFSLVGTEAVHESVSTNYMSYSSPVKFVRENISIDIENPVGTSRVISSPISIPITPKTPGEQVGQLGESMPNMWFNIDDLDDHIGVSLPLSQSLDANPQSLKWTFLSKDDNRLNSDTRSEEQLAKEELNNKDTQTPEELNASSASPVGKHLVLGMASFGDEQSFESESTIAVDRVEHPTEGDPSKPTMASNGSWKLWPFSFRRSRSGKAKQPALSDARIVDAELVTTSTGSTDEKRDEFRSKRFKEMFRAITPTSEQLAALNLREGRNTITFTFRTGMLGNQQVDASIYLWKWNTRIVISDVDGTITKSDVLGQFMPLVGMDWCQIGVAHLFSAIKENGYQLLFLSARAIAQAYLTRQFLLNIKQDGKALPDGPIVISPDGLFPSLFREVIRRAPHEFKIACLEDIKALFPPDCNPFYAGFGNRDTDEISYRKVGIPKGKIFIINPKGQVAVQRRIDTKSYTNLHDLVHDMFPPKVAEQEDFNSWNFWKLPPPTIDM